MRKFDTTVGRRSDGDIWNSRTIRAHALSAQQTLPCTDFLVAHIEQIKYKLSHDNSNLKTR